MANKDPVLPFWEFVELQNNFHLHFVGQPGNHYLGDLYRQNPAFIECKRAHPVKFKKIISELKAMHDNCNTLYFGTKYREKLYGVYKMMHPYAEKNLDLFR